MIAYRFLEPLDVLFLRGNKLFGDPGSYGEALVPPWPSVAAGAIRSQMMAEANVDFAAFKSGNECLPELGTLEKPGPFTVAGFWLARKLDDGQVESFHPLPADLVVAGENEGRKARRLSPVKPAAGLSLSAPLPMLPALAADAPAKPVRGTWLRQAGWARYLAGETPTPDDLVDIAKLWKLDPRVGVGLDPGTRRADDGKLFTVQAVALAKHHGFLAAVQGADPPERGTLRFGGDGRACAVRTVEFTPPAADLEAIASGRQCRIVLTSPGIFADGWRLPGCDDAGRFTLGGVSGRLICAAVPRAETVSGWDLANWRPKPAQRAAPAGSVYWMDELEATPKSLDKLAANGLWRDEEYHDSRRAEGFNRFTFAAY